MPSNNASTFSFDKVVAPEVPRLLNCRTFLMASPEDSTLPGNSPYPPGFLELPPRPISGPDWGAIPTLVANFDGRITIATTREVQQHPHTVMLPADSNVVVQLASQAELADLYPSGITDGVNEDPARSDLNEVNQFSLLDSESWDTGASNHFKEFVDDLEQDLQFTIISAEATCVPQRLYQPRGETEREKYVHKANLSSPILFHAEKSSELGIALEEIFKKNPRHLSDRDDIVFEGGGRTISVRIEWPGYPSWVRQLTTRDYRKTPGPITKAKLARNLATCIHKFIQRMETQRMKDDSDPKWRIGPRHIKFEDLILVSLDHVSQGSWQPQLQLRRQMRGMSSRA
ncbi:hypothetical protein BDR04DRAFT_1231820 [Suillus decipiens]|nr:hypothetical protein BDR04DRAFT_1231820 [Suillus decipiens]